MNPSDFDLIAAVGGPPVALEDLDRHLTRICEAVQKSVPGSDAVGITAALDNRFITASCTDSRTLEVDAEQYAVDDGPCLDAYRDRTVNRVDMTQAKQRWPRFTAACERDGVKGFLALPLLSGDRCVGALNVYAFSENSIDDADIELLQLAAGRAADVLAASFDLHGQKQLVAQLEEAIASRAVIEQAKGVLMVTHRLTDAEAFDVLRMQSQRTNVKLREVARRVLEDAGRPAAGNVSSPTSGRTPLNTRPRPTLATNGSHAPSS